MASQSSLMISHNEIETQVAIQKTAALAAAPQPQPLPKASLSRPTRVVCLFFKTEAPTEKIAESCYRFTPTIATRPGEAVFLDIAGSLHLFREDSLLLRLLSVCKRFGATPRITIADDAGTALAMARFGKPARELPIESLQDFASPFDPNPELMKSVRKIIATLRSLGLETVQDFARLPAGTLASRFGEEGVELSRHIRAGYSAPWPLLKLEEKVSEELDLRSLDSMDPCHDLEPLFFLSRGIIDRAMARLRGRGERAAQVELEFTLERHSALKEVQRSWKMQLPVPQGSVQALLPLLRERVAGDVSRNGLAAPVVGLRFTIHEAAPGHGAQRNLFNKREDESEAWDQLLARLIEKLGQERAFVAKPVDRHLPERAWQPVIASSIPPLDLLNPADLPVSSPVRRPTRVLKRPEPVKKLGEMIVHCMNDQHWQVAEWHGPERLSGEWWAPSKGFQRDYYRVVTRTGEQLWVFVNRKASIGPSFGSVTAAAAVSAALAEERLYLHGFFD